MGRGIHLIAKCMSDVKKMMIFPFSNTILLGGVRPDDVMGNTTANIECVECWRNWR